MTTSRPRCPTFRTPKKKERMGKEEKKEEFVREEIEETKFIFFTRSHNPLVGLSAPALKIVLMNFS